MMMQHDPWTDDGIMEGHVGAVSALADIISLTWCSHEFGSGPHHDFGIHPVFIRVMMSELNSLSCIKHSAITTC